MPQPIAPAIAVRRIDFAINHSFRRAFRRDATGVWDERAVLALLEECLQPRHHSTAVWSGKMGVDGDRRVVGSGGKPPADIPGKQVELLAQIPGAAGECVKERPIDQPGQTSTEVAQARGLFDEERHITPAQHAARGVIELDGFVPSSCGR